VREEMVRRKLEPRVQIFASDIDEEALEFARAARYPEGIAAHVAAARLERFFTRQHNSYVVTKEIRELCVFSKHNLVKDAPFSRLDLIVCRNLLIYMESGLQQIVGELFHYALRPSGFLFLGPSENLAGPSGFFLTLDKKHRIFQRGDTLVRPQLAFPLSDERGTPREQARALDLKRSGPAREPDTLQLLEKILVEQFSPAWVVVNAEGGVVYYSPRTGRYLEPPAGAPSTDIYGMARKGLRLELRTALHRAVKRGETVTREDVAVESNGDVQRINLVVRPLLELGDGNHGFYMIVFQELGPPRSKAAAEAEGLLPASTHDRVVQQLESELRATKEHLQATVEELETSNEELTSSNEELLSTNEELQSSNEELQTSKEELQSVNEELETINADLKEKVDELYSANSELQNLHDSTEIATLFLDRELKIKKFTQAATNVFRLIESDAGRPISDIAVRFTGADLVADARAVLRTLRPSESAVRVAEGAASTDYLMRVLPHHASKELVDGVTVTFIDVTHVTRALAHKQHLAALMESSQDAIVGRTRDGIITSWNASATRMFGFSEEEAVGKSVLATIVPPERRQELEEVTARAVRGEAIQPFETERVAKDGRRVPVSVSFSAMRDEHGNVVELSGSFRDLSELARAKAALQQELRNKDQFLAMLSHELRNPLAPLRACLDVLRSKEADEQQRARAREMMGRQVTQLTTLVNDLLDVSRVTSGKIKLARQTLDVVEVVREAVDDVRPQLQAQGLAVKLRLPPRPVWVDGDQTRLAQSVANVLNNAVKFTEAGSIEVGLESDPEAGRAIVTIRDTGVGMDAATLQSLFEPFSQADRSLDRSRGGLGLGLALCKGLIEAHGGSIDAQSDGPGKGSELTIRLPLSKQPPREAQPARPEPAAVAAGADHGRRVLIVEDNPDAAESVALVLQLAGHTVKTVNDGESAVHEAREFRPDVVLCDVGLPGDMDGYAVARTFRADASLRDIRLVALTGYGQEEDIARSAEAGFEIHARKPVDADTLRRMLTELSNRS
jgi:two-component system, chemotaxis family, CheB/CheR fusion protein